MEKWGISVRCWPQLVEISLLLFNFFFARAMEWHVDFFLFLKIGQFVSRFWHHDRKDGFDWSSCLAPIDCSVLYVYVTLCSKL